MKISLRLEKQSVVAIMILLLGLLILTLLIRSHWNQVSAGIEKVSWLSFILICLALLPSVVARTETWKQILDSAGTNSSRRNIYAANVIGLTINNLNIVLGTTARIAILRFLEAKNTLKPTQLAVAELPLIWIEASLATILLALTAATLHLPFWLIIIIMCLAIILLVALKQWEKRSEKTQGLAIISNHRQLAKATFLMASVYGFQMLRMGLALSAVGLHPQLFLLAAAFVAAGILGTLPLGPSSVPGALAAVFSIQNVALALAAGVVLTAASIVMTVFLSFFASIFIYRQHKIIKKDKQINVTKTDN